MSALKIALVTSLALILCSIRCLSAKNAIIENGATITSSTVVGPDVHLYPKVRVGPSVLEKGVTLKYGCEVGKHALLGEYCTAEEYAEVGDACHMEQHSILGAHSKLVKTHVGFRSTVGEHSELIEVILKARVVIGGNVKLVGVHVGDNSIVYRDTVVPTEVIIPPYCVVMRAPDTMSLIEMMPHGDFHSFHETHKSNSEIFLQNPNDFEKLFGNEVDSVFEYVRNSCSNVNDPNDSDLKIDVGQRLSYLFYVYLLHKYGEQFFDSRVVDHAIHEDIHFGCSSFSSIENNFGEKLTNAMRIVTALHHDTKRQGAERGNDISNSFCHVASKLIRQKIKVLTIDARCVKEKKHKCLDDCGNVNNVLLGRNQLIANKKNRRPIQSIDKSDHNQRSFGRDHDSLKSEETSEGSMTKDESMEVILAPHICKKIAETVELINERNTNAPGIPFTRKPVSVPFGTFQKSMQHERASPSLLNTGNMSVEFPRHNDSNQTSSGSVEIHNNTVNDHAHQAPETTDSIDEKSMESKGPGNFLKGLRTGVTSVKKIASVVDQGTKMLEDPNSPTGRFAKLALKVAANTPQGQVVARAIDIAKTGKKIYDNPQGAVQEEMTKQFTGLGKDLLLSAFPAAAVADKLLSSPVGNILKNQLSSGAEKLLKQGLTMTDSNQGPAENVHNEQAPQTIETRSPGSAKGFFSNPVGNMLADQAGKMIKSQLQSGVESLLKN